MLPEWPNWGPSTRNCPFILVKRQDLRVLIGALLSFEFRHMFSFLVSPIVPLVAKHSLVFILDFVFFSGCRSEFSP